MTEKKVRFAKFDPKNLLPSSKPNQTSYFKSNKYCSICGSFQIEYNDSFCTKCLSTNINFKNKISKPRISQSFSKSEQCLSKYKDNNVSIELPIEITDFFRKKSLEFENLDDKIKNISKPKKFSSFNRTKSNEIFSELIWKCYKCDEKLSPGELAVSAEPIFDSLARWHIKCFCCCVCSNLLVDLLYYTKDKKIYCDKHYFALKPSLICAACDMSIESNEFIKAENQYFHFEHFTCWNCEKSLGGKKYVAVDSKPYCFDCHLIYFSKKCATCQIRIGPEITRLTYDQLDWHNLPTCFKCYNCSKSLLESHFLLKKNLLFCSLDCKKKTAII